MELIFETLDIYDIVMNPYHSMIDPIVNSNFEHKLHHQNGPNHRKKHNKNTSQQYHYSTTRKRISTETMANSIRIDIPFNNINPDTSKDIERLQPHSWKKILLDVDSTKMCEINANSTLWNTMILFLHRTIVNTRRDTQRTTPPEQSKTCIKVKIIQ